MKLALKQRGLLARRQFLALSLAQRRAILKAQAADAQAYYANSPDWREWESADLTTPTDD